MPNYAVTGDQLTAIADAIRLRTENPAQMSVDDMPLQIGLIPSGGGVEYEEHTYTIDITQYKSYNTLTNFADAYKSAICADNRNINIVSCTFVNNTSTTRAGISANFVISNAYLTSYVHVQRVGYQGTHPDYGVDVYAGATLEFDVITIIIDF